MLHILPSYRPLKVSTLSLSLDSLLIYLVFRGDPMFSDDQNPLFSHADPT